MENLESKNRTLVVRGREQELERLMVEHEAGLLRYAARIVNDDNIAQDVVQKSFIKLYRGWKNGSRPGHISRCGGLYVHHKVPCRANR